MSLKHLTYIDHIRVGSLLLDLSTQEGGGEAPSFSDLLGVIGDSFDVDDQGRVVADTTKAASYVVRIKDVMIKRWGEKYVGELLERIWQDSKSERGKIR